MRRFNNDFLKLQSMLIFFSILVSNFSIASVLSLGNGAASVVNSDHTLLAYFKSSTTNSNGTVVVKNIQKNQLVFESAPFAKAYKMSFDSSSEKLAIVTDPDQIKILNIKSGKIENEIKLPSFSFVRKEYEQAGILSRRQSIEFSPNGKFLLARVTPYACEEQFENSVAFVDLDKSLVILRPSNAITGDLRFSDDSSAVYIYDICGGSNTMHYWSTNDPNRYEPLGTLGWGVYTVATKSYSQQILRLSEGSRWNLSRIGSYNMFQHNFDWVSEEMSFGPKVLTSKDTAGTLVEAGGKIYFFDRNIKYELPIQIKGYASSTNFVASSGWKYASSLVFSMRSDNKRFILIWDLSTKKLLKEIEILELQGSVPEFIGMDISEANRTINIVWRKESTNHLEAYQIQF